MKQGGLWVCVSIRPCVGSLEVGMHVYQKKNKKPLVTVQVLVVIRMLLPPPLVGDCGRAMYKRLNPALGADHKHVRDWVFMAAESTVEDIILAAKAHAAHPSLGTVILPLAGDVWVCASRDAFCTLSRCAAYLCAQTF